MAIRAGDQAHGSTEPPGEPSSRARCAKNIGTSCAGLDRVTALDEAESLAFSGEYKAALRDAYPERADGKTLFAFKRLFMVIGL